MNDAAQSGQGKNPAIARNAHALAMLYYVLNNIEKASGTRNNIMSTDCL